MTDYTLQTGRKPDGRSYDYFVTYDVMVGGRMVGSVQCVGPCRGIGSDPNHKHRAWMAFCGPDGELAKNLPGGFPSPEEAAEAILEAVARG